MEKLVEGVDESNLCAVATGESLLIDDGKVFFYEQPGYTKGNMGHSIPGVLYYASRCDSILFDSNLKVGESMKSYDGGADSDYTPDGKIEGHWNFFHYHSVYFDSGKIKPYEDKNFSFEWKDGRGTGDMSYHLAVNFFMSILADATGCIWDDEWKPGVKMTIRGRAYFKPVTELTVEHLDYVEVAAGRFKDCLKVSLDIKGDNNAGWNNFLKGKKEYYFAKGIGLIKGVHYFKNDTVVPNYELTYYEGTGDGYMPVRDGLFRRYEGMGMIKGYIGKAEYTFIEGDDGVIKILESNIGIRDKTVAPYLKSKRE